MKVAIENGALKSGHSVRGIGTYLSYLLAAMGDKVSALDFSTENLSSYDVVHYPFFSLYQRSLPFFAHKHTVVTIHDLIPLIYPKHYPPSLRGKVNFKIQRRLTRKASAIITDSETSKKDIVRFLGIDERRVFPIYLAPALGKNGISQDKKLKIARKYNLPKEFVLYVGDINYNKNFPGLIEAVLQANVHLVVVGKQALEINTMDLTHPELRHLSRVASKLKKAKKVHIMGYVPDEDLPVIYSLATVYCQPSFYEGFGLPVLEAQVAGVPVVASRTQAIVEIAGASAVYFNPYDVDEMKTVLVDVMDNEKLRKEMVKRGRVNVSKFDWEKTARETFAVYEKICK